MALTLITGRANSGKTGAVYAALRDAVRAGLAPSLVLPAYPDAARATAELSRTVPMGLRIIPMTDWVSDLWRLHGDGRRIIDQPQRQHVVAEAIGEVRPLRLAASASAPGFIPFISRLAVLSSGQRTKKDRERSATDEELLALLEAYESALLRRELIEQASAAIELAAIAPAIEGPIAVHRFSDLTPPQEHLLTSLSTGSEVCISLPWEKDFPATAALDGLVARLSRVAERCTHLANVAPGTELDRLEAELFTGARAREPEGAIEFCTAGGLEAEASLIASRAAALTAEFPPDNVAIVLADATRDVEPLRFALAAVGLDADFDLRLPFAETAFGKAAVGLLGFSSGRQELDGLLAFLRSPFSAADPGALDRLEAKWRARRISDAAGFATQAPSLGASTRRALDLALGARGAAGPERWKNLADCMLSAALGSGVSPVSLIDAAAHRALVDTAFSLGELGPDSTRPQALLEALGSAFVRTGGVERPGRLQVTEPLRLRGRRFEAIIVAAWGQGGFAFRSVSTANEIAGRLYEELSPSQRELDRLLFYDVVTRPRKKLVLIRRTSDSSGIPLRPPVFWEETLDLFRTPDADEADTAEDEMVSASLGLACLEDAAPSATPGRALLRRAAARRDPALAPDRQRLRALLEEIREHGGELRDEGVLEALASRPSFSVTELETYSQCPYRWFYERMVRPRRLDVALDAATLGELAHRVLQAFYAGLPATLGVERVSPQILDTALESAAQLFAAEAERYPRPKDGAEEDSLAQTRRMVLDLISADSTFLPAFTPAQTELRFGGSSEPFEIEGLSLAGTIDRVDESEEGIVVIDYKRGEAHKRGDFEKQRVLQVPLYAAVAQRMLQRPVLGGLYRSLARRESRGFYLGASIGQEGLVGTDALDSREEIEELLQAAVAMARDAAEGIHAGVIAPTAPAPGACRYCSARVFCPREA